MAAMQGLAQACPMLLAPNHALLGQPWLHVSQLQCKSTCGERYISLHKLGGIQVQGEAIQSLLKAQADCSAAQASKSVELGGTDPARGNQLGALQHRAAACKGVMSKAEA